MPQLGETVNEGTIAAWHKKAGDDVTKDEFLLDVETEKVAVEIPAPVSGVLTSILVGEGETVVVPDADISIQQEGGALQMVNTSADLMDVVNALNALGASPQDLMSILQALKSAGALNAELEII